MTVDLSTKICSVEFKNPFILSSATPTKTAINIQRAWRRGGLERL
ncbi:MAG: hypothetical protein ACUVTM_06915 [Candidatus Bathyarchaeia archaeon]